MSLPLTLWHSKVVVVTLLSAAARLTAQPAEQWYEIAATKYLLGTRVEIKATHVDIVICKQAFYLAFEEMARIEKLLSSHRSDSEIWRINGAAGRAAVKVSEETVGIVKRALGYARRFDGAFDITIGPVSTLWAFNDDSEISIPDGTPGMGTS